MKLWVAFVGIGRSGGTILSSILDSHPDCRVSLIERNVYLDVLLEKHQSKEDVFKETFRPRLGWYQRHGYFLLPGLLETTLEDAKVIGGEKRGPALVRAFERDSDIVSKFSDFMEMPVKIVHHSRDPINNMASKFKSPKYKRSWGEDDQVRASRCAEHYSNFYDSVQRLFDSSGVEVFDFRNEDLCNSTEDLLLRLCEFLGLESNDLWMDPILEMVYKKPNVHQVNWPEGFVDDFDIPWECLKTYRRS